jgi:hypothetical protein
MKSSNNNSNPYDYVDAVISDIGHSIKHEEEEEKAKANNGGGRIADPPNFRPIIKRKYSSGKLSTLEQHNDNNITDHGNPTTIIGSKVISTATTFSFDAHPDDESSTFIRAKNSRLILYIRRKFVPLMHRIRNNYNTTTTNNNNGTSINYIISNVHQQTKNNKILVRKLSLICLVLLTFIFLNFGYTASESSDDAALRRSTTTSSLLHQTNTNTNNNSGGGGSALQLSFISGYQAKSQVPIPMEYTHFVELSEFVDAVTVIRIHREQTLRQQQQEQQNDGRGRRLDEDNNKEEDEAGEAKEGGEVNQDENEEEEVDNAIDKAWEEAVHKNPELEQQQQQQIEQQQQEQTNMLMVHHVPFFWHSE